MNVTAKIEKLVTSTYRIPISEIDKNNIPDGYSAEIVQSSINITLSGLQKYHDSFNVNNLNAYVDLKNTVEGNNEVIVKFTLPEGLRVVSEVRVNVLITKITVTIMVKQRRHLLVVLKIQVIPKI